MNGQEWLEGQNDFFNQTNTEFGAAVVGVDLGALSQTVREKKARRVRGVDVVEDESLRSGTVLVLADEPWRQLCLRVDGNCPRVECVLRVVIQAAVAGGGLLRVVVWPLELEQAVGLAPLLAGVSAVKHLQIQMLNGCQIWLDVGQTFG